MLVYKVDIMDELKKAGYSSYRIRRENILGQATITALNQKRGISWSSLERICELLNCQPNDLIESICTNICT